MKHAHARTMQLSQYPCWQAHTCINTVWGITLLVSKYLDFSLIIVGSLTIILDQHMNSKIDRYCLFRSTRIHIGLDTNLSAIERIMPLKWRSSEIQWYTVFKMSVSNFIALIHWPWKVLSTTQWTTKSMGRASWNSAFQRTYWLAWFISTL